MAAEKVEAEEADQSTEDAAHRKAVGYVERIELHPEVLRFNAKLTPGSEGNVLHAENPEKFMKNDEEWIRFEVTDRKAKTIVFERPLVGATRFKTTKGKIKKRYIIRSGFCLDTKYMEVDFALDDRSNFSQEVRIGRDALAGHFIVDPAKTKTTKPRCKLRTSNKSE
jgi:hypothetical protein